MASKPRVTHAAFRRGIGVAVRTFREAEGMEPGKLAELSEFDLGELDAIEKGEYLDLGVWGLERIAAVLGIRPSQIMALGETVANRPSKGKRT